VLFITVRADTAYIPVPFFSKKSTGPPNIAKQALHNAAEGHNGRGRPKHPVMEKKCGQQILRKQPQENGSDIKTGLDEEQLSAT